MPFALLLLLSRCNSESVLNHLSHWQADDDFSFNVLVVVVGSFVDDNEFRVTALCAEPNSRYECTSTKRWCAKHFNARWTRAYRNYHLHNNDQTIIRPNKSFVKRFLLFISVFRLCFASPLWRCLVFTFTRSSVLDATAEFYSFFLPKNLIFDKNATPTTCSLPLCHSIRIGNLRVQWLLNDWTVQWWIV